MVEVNTQPRKQRGHHIAKQFDPLFKKVMLEPTGGANGMAVGRHEFVCCTENSIPDMKECPPGDFPNNISKWIWSSMEDDASFAQCIVELAPEEVYEGKRYAYFQYFREDDGCTDDACKKLDWHTICDKSDSHAAGLLLVVSDIRHIIEFLAPGPYEIYMKETEAAEEW